MPNTVAYLNRTTIFECYVVKYGSKNGYQKDTCFIEIGLYVLRIHLPFLDSNNQHNGWKRTDMTGL